MKHKIDFESVWKELDKGLAFNRKIDLEENVEAAENFFIGRQWEGVQANGLPTPVFNFLKRVTLFSVASITSDNLKINAAPFSATLDRAAVERVGDVVNREFERLLEENKLVNLLREYMRNAAVDGDGCLYTYWDGEAETGMPGIKGAVRTEILDNTRVIFGNPNDRRVRKQPYILIIKSLDCDEVKEMAKDNGCKGWQNIKPDGGELYNENGFLTDDKVTVVLRLWMDKKTKSIHGYECCRHCDIRKEWDLGIRRYPITWLNWDYVKNNYHGQGLITGLIPNQIFINKLFAMSMISLMTTAYPKIVYDKTRVDKWDNRVGAAIGIRGGDVNNVAKIIDPAQISPQIAQFIELAVNYTQTFLGATPAALGDTRPDNTSAIIALQRAASTPSELTKQNLYESFEELSRIYMEFMAQNYGKRPVRVAPPKDTPPEILEFANVHGTLETDFDFDVLKDVSFHLKVDIGASSYWSEIASMQTLDNLLQLGQIDLEDYLERMPDGYITKKDDLLAKIRSLKQSMQDMRGVLSGGAGGTVADNGMPQALPATAGNSALQRKITNPDSRK